ncbi:hypothetical protein K2173_023251 [Erythroxylum novogranatense]|uniref:Uncharacterized protein n=1 Tax=Erythroxylum novogranatense TaxID=1862640 RepID=A0AAV8T8B4_9ROSI|nr:hypothetical protein K2173_023251 [Erythroxylum novogranatense]
MYSKMDDEHLISFANDVKTQGNQKNHSGGDLWTDGLACAFEQVRVPRKMTQSNSGPRSRLQSSQDVKVKSWEHRFDHKQSNSAVTNTVDEISGSLYQAEPTIGTGNYNCSLSKGYWMPIGWGRISELAQMVQVDTGLASQPINLLDDEDDGTVTDVAAPYLENPVGPTWWCHVSAGYPRINSWLSNARLLLVPVIVAGGLLFELLGQSAGDPDTDEYDTPIILRSWQSQNFLVTVMHVKGLSSNINLLGIAKYRYIELLAAGGISMPRCIHEVIAHLTSRLARWDDRLFRKSIFGVADEVELKFMNRRIHEDMHLFSIILNQEIRRLSTQVIRVKWSLHAREEVVFELLQHLRGNRTREMIQEQEAVRGRLFTIQDVMQSTVRAWLQDRSLRVTHNLGVSGGCSLVLSIITRLFGINVDGIPGNNGSPFAFALFSGILFLLGIVLIVIGLMYLGLKKLIIEEDVAVTKLELQEFFRIFKHEVESYAQVRKTVPQVGKPVTTGTFVDG